MFSFACIVLSKLIRSTNKNVLCFMHNSKRGWEAEVLQKIHEDSPVWFLTCVTSPGVRCFVTDSYFGSAVVYVPYIRFWHHQKSSSETFLWEAEWEADRKKFSPVLGKGMKNISHKKRETASSQECNAVCLWLCRVPCSEALTTLLFFFFLLESRQAVDYLHPSLTDQWVSHHAYLRPHPWQHPEALCGAALLRAGWEARQRLALEEQVPGWLLRSHDTHLQKKSCRSGPCISELYSF